MDVNASVQTDSATRDGSAASGRGTTPPPRRHRSVVPRLRAALSAYALIGPSLIGVVAFLLAPVVIVAVVSLFRWNLMSSPKFVGLANYRRMAHDGSVWHA